MPGPSLSSKAPAETYHLTLLRHGESQGNARGVIQGQADFPLSPKGEQQARVLAERWRAERREFDLLITSPLARARQTAAIISTRLEIPLEEDHLWMERDFGAVSGVSRDEIASTRLIVDFVHPYHPLGDHGESTMDLYLRAGRAVNNVLKRGTGRYLIVAHGGIFNMALYAILGIPPQANYTGPRFQFGNTAFASLSYNPGNHQWRLWGINDQSHLEG